MKIQRFLCASIAMNSAIFGSESLQKNSQTIAEKNPNHFYFGPEFQCYQLNTHIETIRVHGTRFFSGLRLGYEYLKPKAFYAGVDLLATSTGSDFGASLKGGAPFSWHRADRGFGNLEVRFGYTFAPVDWMITPFLGGGVYNVFAIDHHNHQGFKEDLPYMTGGLISKYSFNSTFELGFSWQIFGTIGAKQRFRFEGGKNTTHHNMWGGEFGIPLDWHIGRTKRWDIELEPYALILDFSGKQNIYGLRLLFGYRF